MYQVIIIEDDPMVASINRQYVELNRNLRVAGHFTNGQDALLFLEHHHADLAILDVYMPVMDGIALLKELRKRNKTLDVIMVTAANEPDQVKELLSLGVLDYLVKPFEYVRFNHALALFMMHQDMLSGKDSVTQQELDRLLHTASVSDTKTELLNKGMQEKTLTLIRNYMKEHKGEPLTSEKIAEEIKLSRVTVRRYMNYLLEQNEIVSDIDYRTGGRPSIIYRYLHFQD